MEYLPFLLLKGAVDTREQAGNYRVRTGRYG
jgi:hypothetical protein